MESKTRVLDGVRLQWVKKEVELYSARARVDLQQHAISSIWRGALQRLEISLQHWSEICARYPVIGPYGTLTEDHFNTLKDFWNYVNSNPQEHGVIQAEAAYVLPADYGFGFRSPDDKIWGLWNADNSSQKVWDDANKLLDQYDSRLDTVYNEPEVMDAMKSRYDHLIFWNETVT